MSKNEISKNEISKAANGAAMEEEGLTPPDFFGKPLADMRLVELQKSFPPESIKQRKIGGGMMADYLETSTVINRLNYACPQWDLEVKEFNVGDRMATALVRLTIPGIGHREQVGIQEITSGGGDLIKGAISDGLKKAASLFGVGIQLYGTDYERDARESQAEQAQNEEAEKAKRRMTAISIRIQQERLRIWGAGDDADALYRRWLTDKHGRNSLKGATLELAARALKDLEAEEHDPFGETNPLPHGGEDVG